MINQPNFEFSLSDSSTLAAEVAAEIREHNAHVERHENEKREIESVAEWSPAASARAAELGRRKVELIASEIRVRQRIGGLYENVAAADLPAACQSVIEVLQTMTTKTRSGLVELGYLDGPAHLTGQTFTIDYLVTCHPSVRAAQAEADSFPGRRRSLLLDRQANIDSLADAGGQLAAEKRAAIASI